MSKRFYCVLLSMLTISVHMSAAFPSFNIGKGAESAIPDSRKVKEIPETGWITMVDEHFDAMTKGTPELPDEELLTGEDIIIPEEYTVLPDWSGAGVYQAGGACAINFPSVGGYLNTPEMLMTGLVKVSFDAKVFDEIRAFDIFVCDNGIDNPTKVAPYQSIRMFDTDGWDHYELYFQNPSNRVAFVQFRVIYYGANDRGIVLDNILVERQPDFISEVETLKATNFTSNGFELKWSASELTDDYLVSIYEQTPVSPEDRFFTEDFESFEADENGKIISGNEGWSFSFHGNHPQLVEHTSGKALMLGRHQEIVEFPSFGGKFIEFKMDVTHILGDNPNAWGTMADVEGWNGSEWVWITDFSSEDEYFTFDLGEWEDEVDFFEPEEKHFRGLYTKIRLIVGSANYGSSMLIDNVEFQCEPDTESVAVVENEKVSGTSYVFEGLDPDATYYAGVRAVTSNYTSDEKTIEVYGIASPVALMAEDVSEDMFTARWEPANNASLYQVSSYDCLVVKAPVDQFTIIEEEFDLVTDCADSYYHPDKISSTDLSDYTHRSGWTGVGAVKVIGNIGCSACFFDPGTKYIISPDITLSNNNGEFDVFVKAWVRAESRLVVMSHGDGVQSEEVEEDGLVEFVFHMKNGKSHDQLAFLSYDGQAFFIDEVKVVQSLKENDILLEGAQTFTLDADSFEQVFNMTARDSEWGRAYDVRAAREDYSRSAISDYSETILVDTPVKVKEIENDGNILIGISGRELRISLLQSQSIIVTTINGINVANIEGGVGVNTIQLPAAGVYLVKIGNHNYKLISK